MNDFSAVLLAGGKSTRMGRDKATLPFGDGTLLTVQYEKLRALGITDILVSGYGEGMIPDAEPGCGPLGGLAACLPRAQHPRVLVISVDVPLVSETTLRALIAAHTGGVTILRHGERTEPLIAVYDAALGETAQQLLAQGKRAVRALLESTECRVVDVEVPEWEFLNCNTPETYAEALRSTGGDGRFLNRPYGHERTANNAVGAHHDAPGGTRP